MLKKAALFLTLLVLSVSAQAEVYFNFSVPFVPIVPIAPPIYQQPIYPDTYYQTPYNYNYPGYLQPAPIVTYPVWPSYYSYDGYHHHHHHYR